MRRAMDDEAGRVVHVVGTLSDEVCRFIGPATEAVARSGREQTVAVIDQARYRHHLPRLHASAEVVLAPRDHNPFKQWAAFHQACCTALAQGPLHAVHLHGLLPALVGAQALRAQRASQVPVYFSPHGSMVLARLAGTARVLRALLNVARGAAIVNAPQESRQFEDWPASELVETPVADAFFGVTRREARHPLVIAGGRAHDARNAEPVAQLAVLLSGSDLRIGFNWIGAVSDGLRVKLNAAGIGVFEVQDEPECAARMAPGWLYVAPAPSRGFALSLAEAMAAGLPCVVLDCPAHRQLVLEGETGFLCANVREMLARVAELIDDAALRERVGLAARVAARTRFGLAEFDSKLLAAYAIQS